MLTRLMTVYCSAPMDKLNDYYILSSKLEYAEYIHLYIPPYNDYPEHVYVFADLALLEKCDVLVCHIPFPSVGACTELGFFKAKKPHSPVIAYNCMEHGWLKHLCNFHCTTLDEVAKLLDALYDSMSR